MPVRGRRGGAARLALGLVALLAGCTTLAAPTAPRRVLPVPAAPIAPPAVRELAEFAPGRVRGELAGAGEVVAFQVWRTAAPAPRPLVLLVPILAGGQGLLEAVAERMLDRGFDVAFCARAGAALKAPQRGADLQQLFRRTVLHQRLLLAWLRSADQPAAAGTFVLGMSMGGMVTTVLAAQEPTLDGIAICLSGGDLAGLVLDTSERRVIDWVAWRRREDGVGADHLQWELQQELHYEPIAWAPAVPTTKVLFVSASFDTVVRPRHQDLLWEALGRPQRLCVPSGHYSAALAIGPILTAVAQHFRQQPRQQAAAAPR
jgi:pimeloyl-ACP methyl ester carboxylesterase